MFGWFNDAKSCASRSKRESLRRAGHRLRQNFDRNVTPELGVPRPIDFPYAAGTNELDDFVQAEAFAHVEGHALLIRRNEPLKLFEPVRHQLHPCRGWR